jgi:hypothetical protein
MALKARSIFGSEIPFEILGQGFQNVFTTVHLHFPSSAFFKIIGQLAAQKEPRPVQPGFDRRHAQL